MVSLAHRWHQLGFSTGILTQVDSPQALKLNGLGGAASSPTPSPVLIIRVITLTMRCVRAIAGPRTGVCGRKEARKDGLHSQQPRPHVARCGSAPSSCICAHHACCFPPKAESPTSRSLAPSRWKGAHSCRACSCSRCHKAGDVMLVAPTRCSELSRVSVLSVAAVFVLTVEWWSRSSHLTYPWTRSFGSR